MADAEAAPSRDEMFEGGLTVTPEKIRGFKEALGPQGIGAFFVRQALNGMQIAALQEEAFNPSRVGWRDNHNRFVNQRGLEVIENHTVYALKLHRGDRTPLARVPRLRQLAGWIEQFLRSQSGAFPSLAGWTADEMSLHRYDTPDIGLSKHRDNARFSGMVVIATLEGEGDLVIRDPHYGIDYTFSQQPGDLALLRGNGLYPHPKRDAAGKLVNIGPEHAALNLRTPFRTSFIVRANNRPDDPVPGFEYDNWTA